MPDTDSERKGVPEHRSNVTMYWKDLSPRVLLPILGTRRCEYLRLSEVSEKESRDEVMQTDDRLVLHGTWDQEDEGLNLGPSVIFLPSL